METCVRPHSVTLAWRRFMLQRFSRPSQPLGWLHWRSRRLPRLTTFVRPPSSSELNLTLQVEDASAFQLDAVAGPPAADLAAAPRGLEGADLVPAKPVGPIGGQHAVCRAGHRVLRDAL